MTPSELIDTWTRARWKVLDRVLTADRERVRATEADRVQDRSLDSLQRQVDELRVRVETVEKETREGMQRLRARAGG